MENQEKANGINMNDLLEIINDYYESTDDNVVSVGYGYKTINGVTTNEKSIIFTVKEKIPLDQLAESQKLPSSIDIRDGTVLKTDVNEGQALPMGCSSFYTWKTSPPSNRNKIRPIRGGTSAINGTDLAGYACTLGFIAKDNNDGKLVAISNAHCALSNPFAVSATNYDGIYAANSIVQPSEGANYDNTIGYVKRYPPLVKGGENIADVCIYALKDDVLDYDSYKQYGLNINNPLPFATTAELDDLINSDPLLFSSGRTTGAKGEGSVKLRINQIGMTSTVGPYIQGEPDSECKFSNLIGFIATEQSVRPFSEVCDYPVSGGDSGSALIAEIGGQKKIIGLVFAGRGRNVNGSIVTIEGIAARIDLVASHACISEWTNNSQNGSQAISQSDLSTDSCDLVDVFTLPGRLSKSCLNFSGKIYNNLGYYGGGDFTSPAGELVDVNILNPISTDGLIDNFECCSYGNGGGNGGGDGGGNGGGNGGGGSECPPCPTPSGNPGGVTWSAVGGVSASSSKIDFYNYAVIANPLTNCPPCPPNNNFGGNGDIHYWITDGNGKAGTQSLIFRDENYYPSKSHWVVEWVEINQQDQVSAILSRRSSVNLFQTTTSNSKYYVYGNPIGLTYSLTDSDVMAGMSFTVVPGRITRFDDSSKNELKYVGGMAVEFLRQTAREGPITSPRLDQIGRNRSFVEDNRFRLISGSKDMSPVEKTTAGGRESISINTSSLRKALEDYVFQLTGADKLLYTNNISPLESFSSFNDSFQPYGKAPSPTGAGTSYPMLLNTKQFRSLQEAYIGLLDYSTQDIKNTGTGISSSVNPGSSLTDFWSDLRKNRIRQELSPVQISCQKCIGDINFQIAGNNCNTYSGEFKFALKKEIENPDTNGGIKLGPNLDCRCCGAGQAENHYWNDSSFCGREESLCLPLAVIRNGSGIGFDNYGYDHKVVPFYANKNDDMGTIRPSKICLSEQLYVINGKLLTGKFHTLTRTYNINNSINFPYPDRKDLESFYARISDDRHQTRDGMRQDGISGVVFMANNLFKGDLIYDNVENPL